MLELNSLELLYASALALSICFGFVARLTQFCPLGGIADIIQTGNNGRFLMYIFAIGIAIIGASTLEYLSILSFDNTKPPYRMSSFRWPGYVLGGFLFGLGMTFSRGCGMKNMLNLGSGDFRALVAVSGMAIAGYTLLYVDGAMVTAFGWVSNYSIDLTKWNIEHQDLGSIASSFIGGKTEIWRPVLGLIIAGTFIKVAFSSSAFKSRTSNIIGGFLIGSFIIGAYYISGGQLADSAKELSNFMDEPQFGLGMQSYTFIRPMGDTVQVLSNPVLYLVTLGLVMFIGVGLGSFIYSVPSRNFRFKKIELGTAPRYFIGGLLVGTGGIVGMGCTLGQGLAGTSTLALGSFVNLVSLIVGAYIGIKIQPGFMSDHQVPH